MCLTIDYFERRAEEKIKYEEQGYVDLDTLTETYGITLEQLAKICLFKTRGLHSTVDLYHYDITKKGSNFFEMGNYQIILFKPNRLNELIAALKEAKGCEKEIKTDFFKLSFLIFIAEMLFIFTK